MSAGKFIYLNTLGAGFRCQKNHAGRQIMPADLQTVDSRIMLNDWFPGMAAAPPFAPHSSSYFRYTEDVVDLRFSRPASPSVSAVLLSQTPPILTPSEVETE